MIEVESLAVLVSGETQSSDLEISIGAGGKVGIVSPNGSGKSTLLGIPARGTAPETTTSLP